MTISNYSSQKKIYDEAFKKAISEMKGNESQRVEVMRSPLYGILPELGAETVDTYAEHLSRLQKGGTLYQVGILHDIEGIYHTVTETMWQALISSGELVEVAPGVHVHKARQQRDQLIRDYDERMRQQQKAQQRIRSTWG